MYDLNLFTTRVQELIRRVTPYDDRRRATMQDLATAVNLSRSELSNRLNANKGAKLTARDVRAVVSTLADWGAIRTQGEALELLALVECPPFTAADWLAPPLDALAPPATTPPAASSVRLHNLPLRQTSFVGREREIGTILQLLSQTHLLTLTGEGGCGKTRLALELGDRLAERFTGGVWLVELAALRDPALVPAAVARVLAVREQAGEPILDAICIALGDRELLLILDNCEHLLTAAANLVHGLLVRCPGLRVLATSRETLRVAGEVTWRVPSLSLPAADEPIGPSDLTRYQATRLFLERAKAAQPGFHLSERGVAAVRQLCQQLDGIPLAIELAAARLRVLSVEQIAARMGDRFRLLTVGDRSALPRQQTLKALVDWSYDLLEEEERTLFRQLAVFSGSFDAAAAAACVTPASDADEMLDRLGQLVEKSLLVRDEQAEMQYRMLETIREYAALQLAVGGGLAAIQARHFACYLALAERAEGQLTGAEQATWLDRLEAVQPNLRAALSWGLQAQPTEALRLAAALWRFWMIRAHLSEGRRWLSEGLATASNPPPSSEAKALYGLGFLALTQGDNAAEGYYGQALAIQERVGDREGAASSRNGLGIVARSRGDFSRARDLFEQNVEVFRALADYRKQAVSLNNLGGLAWEQADYAAAQPYFADCLRIFNALGDEQSIASVTNNLGQVAYKQGELATARQLLGDSLARHYRLQNKEAMADTLTTLAELDITIGQTAAGVRGYAAAQHLRAVNSLVLTASQQLEQAAILAQAAQQLGEDEYRAAWEDGQELPLGEVVASRLQPQGAAAQP